MKPIRAEVKLQVNERAEEWPLIGYSPTAEAVKSWKGRVLGEHQQRGMQQWQCSHDGHLA